MQLPKVSEEEEKDDERSKLRLDVWTLQIFGTYFFAFIKSSDHSTQRGKRPSSYALSKETHVVSVGSYTPPS